MEVSALKPRKIKVLLNVIPRLGKLGSHRRVRWIWEAGAGGKVIWEDKGRERPLPSICKMSQNV